MKTCVACAEQIQAAAVLCRYCNTLQPGEQAPASSAPNTAPQPDTSGVPTTFEIDLSRAINPKTPQEISNVLKGYEKNTSLECLECLYKGTMGVEKSSQVTMARVAVGVAAVFLGFFSGPIIGFIIGIAAAAIIIWFLPHPLRCPNCNSLLKRVSTQ